MQTKGETETTETLTKVKWTIDPSHSEIAFKVKHLMITNVKGVFREFDASIYTTGEDFITSEVDFFLNPASVDTGDSKRDEHIRSEDFFDVEKYKQISFVGDTIEKGKNDKSYSLYGYLQMKGITKQIKLNVEFAGVMKDPWGNEKAGFNITGKINRKDWGLNWNSLLETGGVMLSDEVNIMCEVQLVKQK
ncbi:MAG: YceI family protein [Bacteroidetes bacterium]|nr:YceI family protein [Bacteroidota bacterium]